jgi:hypothetical protein
MYKYGNLIRLFRVKKSDAEYKPPSLSQKEEGEK